MSPLKMSEAKSISKSPGQYRSVLFIALTWDDTFDYLEDHQPNTACARGGPDHGRYFMGYGGADLKGVNEDYALYAAIKDGVLNRKEQPEKRNLSADMQEASESWVKIKRGRLTRHR